MTQKQDQPKDENPETEQPKAKQGTNVRAFLENVSPNKMVSILIDADSDDVEFSARSDETRVRLPDLQLYCDTERQCDGIRTFGSADYVWFGDNIWKEQFVQYCCRNCGRSRKFYALWSNYDPKDNEYALFKFGEYPEFGPPTPARLVKLLGDEKDYYFKGRRAENQGLGIAAFAYYRRVVVRQKNKFLDEIIRVSKKIGASSEILDDLKVAKEETQFTKAIEKMKHGIPEALRVNGENPLTLLHTALSDGLHDRTDNECLELATSIRVVLTELVDRFATALREEKEVIAAVSRLSKAKALKSRGLKTEK